MSERPRSNAKPSNTERLVAGAVLAALLCALAFLLFRNPAATGWIPPCPSRAALGVYCPGCGSFRSLHHLLNARPADAWRYNPAMILLGVPALGVVGVTAGMVALGRAPRVFRVPVWVAWTLLGALLAYAVLRNLPGANWDSLRPPPP